MLKFVAITAFLFAHSIIAASSIVIGIAGGTGSGKTTLAKKILEGLDHAVLIEQDCYYKDLSSKTIEERSQNNFDHPDSIDFDLLNRDIRALKSGKAIAKPIYSFKTHSREDTYDTVEPADVIVVEGILIFANEQLREQCDLKIFIETADDVRVLRRLERDIHERGRDVGGVTKQYIHTVKPMHLQFVEPSKKFADLIVPGESDTDVAINVILNSLRKT
jgi:uridine kinase